MAITHKDGDSPPSVLWHTDTPGATMLLSSRATSILLHTIGPMSNHKHSGAILGGVPPPLILLAPPAKWLSPLCFSQELLLFCSMALGHRDHAPPPLMSPGL